MGKQPVFSRRISAGSRLYYVDVCTDSTARQYLQISEIATAVSPKSGTHHRIVIHPEFAEALATALSEAMGFITKNENKKNGEEN